MRNECSAEYVKKVLAQNGLRANKSLGQNFLVDARAVEMIVSAVDPTEKDYIVEIGPGLGAVSMPLAYNCGRFTAVELDRNLAGILGRKFMPAEAGLAHSEVVCGDFLKYNMPPANKIFGSLPYYITTPCIRKIFNMLPKPVSAVFVMQREAADKLTALPSGDNYCVLSLETAYNAEVTEICDLPPSSFYPQPGVHSRAVLLKMLDVPPVSADKDLLFKIINAAFAMRRKTLVNCLAGGLGTAKEHIIKTLSLCGFSSDVRGEQLSLKDFDNLTKKLFDNA
jgi:16S rRNA (adenine1518-N6/adenine1519-N6)-dimethyltransferase